MRFNPEGISGAFWEVLMVPVLRWIKSLEEGVSPIAMRNRQEAKTTNKMADIE
jgi:hypothetical protein